MNTVKYNVDCEIMITYENLSIFQSQFFTNSFLFGLIQKSFCLLVFGFDLFDDWRIGIWSLSNIW